MPQDDRFYHTRTGRGDLSGGQGCRDDFTPRYDLIDHPCESAQPAYAKHDAGRGVSGIEGPGNRRRARRSQKGFSARRTCPRISEKKMKAAQDTIKTPIMD